MDSSTLKEVARKAGAHLVGIASVERFSSAPRGHKPSDLLPSARSVIVIGLRIPLSIVRTIPSPLYEEAYDYLNNRLRSIAYDITFYLESEGFDAIPISPDEPDYAREVKVEEGEEPRVRMLASFSHRHAAVLAGLAEFTPASYVVVPKYGPRVRFASIITSASLEPDPLISDGFSWGRICKPENCGFRCIKACPVKALPGDGTVDHYKCRRYRGPKVYTIDYFKRIEELRSKGVPPHIIKVLLPSEYRSPSAHLCGLCLKACPIGIEV